MNTSYIPVIILLLPLIGAIINGLLLPLQKRTFNNHSSSLTGSIATSCIFLSFIVAATVTIEMICTTPLTNPFTTALYSSPLDHYLQIKSPSFIWLSLLPESQFKILFELSIDRLNSVLILIITGVGSLIHLYSIGYMKNDPSTARYFSYLNLFCFFMLLLVMATSLPIMFFGWEGVGLCSYLLIGFWFKDILKVAAGTKAFIINRIGDFGFLLGIFLCYQTFHTLNFDSINTLAGTVASTSIITIITLLLFVGAIGKSAQIPLHTWLPDAMSGPTPVSALIHAATMVTAGVFMIVKLAPLFSLSPFTMNIIAFIGALTALLAATVAIAQNDIKKVLAYSTISQLGFMFLSCGVGAYTTAIFHLTTHAFFKALLFLGAGSVIHACSGEQDMRNMGALKNKLPHTYRTMLIGALSISGIPFFAGFFSKDEILYSILNQTQNNTGEIYFIVALFTALLTAIYSGRLIAMTFLGSKLRLPTNSAKEHLHESPKVMLIPLYILAALATFGGFSCANHKLHLPPTNPSAAAAHSISELTVIIIASLIALTGLTIGLYFFRSRQNFTLKILKHKYYIDELYNLLFVKNYQKLSQLLSTKYDQLIFDYSPKIFIKSLSYFLSNHIIFLQSGRLQIYLLTFLISLTTLIIIIFNVISLR
ncbi:MAG: NADH-quinone oxidoreductase subunit L [Oligoflexia bacterium]|nr:NADH-quinone oxidoreductase subunit L [Oligoflexia bacterium]